MADSISDRILSLQEDIQQEYEQLASLQSERLGLQRRNEKLSLLLASVDVVSSQDGTDPTVAEICGRVLPLMKDIHHLDLRKKEILHQLHSLDIQKDVHGIVSTLCAVTQAHSKGVLFTWFKQLESAVNSDEGPAVPVLSQHPTYEPRLQCDQLVERLGLTVYHRGLSVHVRISSTSPLQSNSSIQEDMTNTTTVQDILATSDVYVDGLTDKVRSLLAQHCSVLELLSFLQDSLDTDIIPFARNEDV